MTNISDWLKILFCFGLLFLTIFVVFDYIVMACRISRYQREQKK